jgi:hypothetical protein
MIELSTINKDTDLAADVFENYMMFFLSSISMHPLKTLQHSIPTGRLSKSIQI